jgi:enamine deaminase RidA (YjgF/YER057c/UK114 family)
VAQSDEPPSALYLRATNDLVEAGLAPIREALYASKTVLGPVLEERERLWVRRFGEGPVTVLTNPSVDGSTLGLQVLAAEGARVAPIFDGAHAAGRSVECGAERWIVLQDLVGRDEAGRLGEPRDQMERMFDRAERLLTVQGSNFREVARTWIYVDPLVPTYDDLNAARDAFFVRTGIRSGRRLNRPPASTGIQGFHPRGAACFLDVVAVQGALSRPVRPAHQPEAWAYGSSFSRGMVVGDLVTISGTASIAEGGETAHIDDAREQILLTWKNILSLLALEGLDASAEAAWTLYFKDARVVEAWRTLEKEGALPDLASVSILADVCRDNLLFEAEVTAVKP